MKRAPELADLSRDHHRALVLARRCQQVADRDVPALVASAWQDLKAEFRAELAPHFDVEERLLLPPLLALHESLLVERTLQDHQRLRELSASTRCDAADLRSFGAVLRAHVRFEERELFPRAEQILAPEQLAAISLASAALPLALQRK